MCVEGIVTPRQRRWRRGRAFCQRASPSPFSLEDPADTADSYACWTDENADEAAVGWTERVRHHRALVEHYLRRLSSHFGRLAVVLDLNSACRRDQRHDQIASGCKICCNYAQIPDDDSPTTLKTNSASIGGRLRKRLSQVR